MKGTYLLLIHCDSFQRIGIGKKGFMDFGQGWYVYVGSALNSLESRIFRHLRSEKKHHWHIDYLLDHADISRVFIKLGEDREECKVASWLSNQFLSVPDFGCSDCHCGSHLFLGDYESLIQTITHMQFVDFSLMNIL